jgi:hypothetical protein
LRRGEKSLTRVQTDKWQMLADRVLGQRARFFRYAWLAMAGRFRRGCRLHVAKRLAGTQQHDERRGRQLCSCRKNTPSSSAHHVSLWSGGRSCVRSTVYSLPSTIAHHTTDLAACDPREHLWMGRPRKLPRTSLNQIALSCLDGSEERRDSSRPVVRACSYDDRDSCNDALQAYTNK